MAGWRESLNFRRFAGALQEVSGHGVVRDSLQGSRRGFAGVLLGRKDDAYELSPGTGPLWSHGSMKDRRRTECGGSIAKAGAKAGRWRD